VFHWLGKTPSLAEKLHITDGNALYELKSQAGKRFNAHFDVELNVKWDYFFEYLPMGLLYHVNSGERKSVNLQGSPEEILRKVLLSPSKGNYESKDECIKQVIDKNTAYSFLACMADPDQQKIDPTSPRFVLI
jgi:hypothetical protein